MYNPEIHHRHSIRIPDYDYSQAGMYFITICTKDKEYIFGDVVNKKMVLSYKGIIAEKMLMKVERLHKDLIYIVEYIIMPNHIHFIVEFKKDYKIKLKDFITAYKSLVTKSIIKVEKYNCTWQRNYYEHIIRNEKELYAIREYIQMNPIKWENDSLYEK